MPILVFVVTLAVVLTAKPACARDYYLSSRGNDGASGAKDTPWRSLARASEAEFSPGDRLLLESGARFEGQLELGASDSGSKKRPLRISVHGGDPKGQSPATVFAGDGSAIVARGLKHFRIENLELTGSGRKRGNDGYGVLLDRCEGAILKELHCSGFRKGGVEISRSRQIRVRGVRATRNGFAGISVGRAFLEPRSANIRIQDCVVWNNPGDPKELRNHSGSGIVVSNVNTCLVDRCEASDNGWDMPRAGKNGPVGIWAWNADRVTIQNNFSHHNRSTGTDGGGFDLDGGVTNSVIQYNVSWANQGAGYLLCQYRTAPEWSGNIVRYNISHDDLCGFLVCAAGPKMSDAEIYNNTVIGGRMSVLSFVEMFSQTWTDVRFRNNVFLLSDSAATSYQVDTPVDERQGKHEVFSGNLFWSADGDFSAASRKRLLSWARESGQEVSKGKFTGIVEAPLLGELDDYLQLPRPSKPRLSRPQLVLALRKLYAPLPGSPCLDKGSRVDDDGGRDLLGRELRGARPLGAISTSR